MGVWSKGVYLVKFENDTISLLRSRGWQLFDEAARSRSLEGGIRVRASTSPFPRLFVSRDDGDGEEMPDF